MLNVHKQILLNEALLAPVLPYYYVKKMRNQSSNPCYIKTSDYKLIPVTLRLQTKPIQVTLGLQTIS